MGCFAKFLGIVLHRKYLVREWMRINNASEILYVHTVISSWASRFFGSRMNLHLCKIGAFA
ncbi:hypothetical protein PCL1606_12530 [Pseudomonas chlororaphis]|uniref:Uncharacterized protein n=1 Tax=Pseudomonas chlororaphis TaxID=587753 RepID=A0A0D5XVK1_9PSED|nr:hypothetical protein PCL1606_12530 [Pseudomonas chlororaphis]